MKVEVTTNNSEVSNETEVEKLEESIEMDEHEEKVKTETTEVLSINKVSEEKTETELMDAEPGKYLFYVVIINSFQNFNVGILLNKILRFRRSRNC